MRWTQADHIIYSIYSYKTYNRLGRGLEYLERGREKAILYNGNPVGYMLEDSQIADEMFMVLTIQRSMLPARVASSLVSAANENEMKVVFVPMIDIGFGLPELPYLANTAHKRTISQVSKYAQDDVKTAIVVCEYDAAHRGSQPIAYSYNQKLGSRIYHAEEVLTEYLKIIKYQIGYKTMAIMDLEPCSNCLQSMIDLNFRTIMYYTSHKDKWNTTEYLDMVDRINSRAVVTKKGWPIKYMKIK